MCPPPLSRGDWALLIFCLLVFGFIALVALAGGMVSGDIGI